MNRKVTTGIMLTLLLVSMSTLAFNIQLVKADWTWTETIYIRADGSVDPTTAPIHHDGNTYTFTGNINESIVVERDNIVVDGTGYTLQGTGAVSSKGIDLTGRTNIIIKNMEIKAFSYGIYLSSSSNNSISGNNITNNKDGIWLYKSLYNTFFGNNVTTNHIAGISVVESSYNTLLGNNIIANGDDGIYHIFSSYNTFSENNIMANNLCGIYFFSSSYNTFSGNNIANSWCGIQFRYSSNNTLFGNDINANDYGIWFEHYSERTPNNVIYHNNFIDNAKQVYIHTFANANILDNGYPSGGNYWSDYAGVDLYSGPHQNETGSDGIIDTPYFIDEDNQDNYPLMEPWSLEPSSPVEATQELIENIDAWNLSKGIETSLIAKLDNAIHLLDKGNAKGATHKLIVFINKVEALRGKKLTNEQTDYLIAEAQRIIDLIEGLTS